MVLIVAFLTVNMKIEKKSKAIVKIVEVVWNRLPIRVVQLPPSVKHKLFLYQIHKLIIFIVTVLRIPIIKNFFSGCIGFIL